MNFKNIEGQIARWLETLASYDFTIIHRSGLTHLNADALSRRPCIDEKCEYCDRIETRYSIKDSGLITRAIGDNVESTDKGECILKEGLSSKHIKESYGRVSYAYKSGKSDDSVKVHIQQSDSVKDIPERTITGGISKGTSPHHIITSQNLSPLVSKLTKDST